MKKLLSLLSVLTISGTAVPTTIAASPYQKEEIKLENNTIGYFRTNNLKTLNRNKRDYRPIIGPANPIYNNPEIKDPIKFYGVHDPNYLVANSKESKSFNDRWNSNIRDYTGAGLIDGAVGGIVGVLPGVVTGAGLGAVGGFLGGVAVSSWQPSEFVSKPAIMHSASHQKTNLYNPINRSGYFMIPSGIYDSNSWYGSKYPGHHITPQINW